MVAIAEKLGLPDAAASIYRTQSMRWIKEGKLGTIGVVIAAVIHFVFSFSERNERDGVTEKTHSW